MDLANMKEQLRQSILKRDGYRCIVCGSEKNLHIHHYVSRWQAKIDGASNELLNHPNLLYTLCSDCHIVISPMSRSKIYTPEEKAELKGIEQKRQELAKNRKELKDRYSNDWDNPQYQRAKWDIDKELKEVQERREVVWKEIKEKAGKRWQSKLTEIEFKLADYMYSLND